MSSINLAVTPRTIIGKANRRLAVENAIPAVVYGNGRVALPVAVDRHDFEMLMPRLTGSTVIELRIAGESAPIHAMVREIQVDALKGAARHVDLMAVAMDKSVHAVVPLHYVNVPDGVRNGGVLNIERHEISVAAMPGNLPEVIEVDVAALGVGDSLHVSDISASAGVTILDDPEETVASVMPPAVEVEASAEITEPEVIGEKA
jgi:large subunit ribosomal protein L25